MSRIGLVQTTTTDDFQANLAYALSQVEQAAALGVELLAFPEVFLFIGGRTGKLAHAQTLDGEVVSRFREAARTHRMYLLLGSLHERMADRDDKVHNTSVLIDPDGDIAGTYRKLRLFDVELPQVRIKESDTIEPGDALPPVIDTPLGRLGLTICFDLRYPELYRHLRREGAQIVFVPSNFTAPTGAAHWEVLLRARAVENQYYVAAPAQYGCHNERYTSYGHSALVDPWGVVLATAPERPGLTVGEVDLQAVERTRAEMPLHLDA